MAITDQKSAQTWLEQQTLAVQTAFAARCALRALPGLGTEDDDTLGVLVLPGLRALLTSCVAVSHPTAEVKRAADAARSTALSTIMPTDGATYSAGWSIGQAASVAAALPDSAVRSADAAVHSAYSASISANSVAFSEVGTFDATTLSAAYSAADRDTKWISNGNGTRVFNSMLWPGGGIPDFFSNAFKSISAIWNAEPEVWGFWARWYDGMLNGTPMDWALQKAVALIPEEVWKAGPEAVAAEIKNIEEELSERSGLDAEQSKTQAQILMKTALRSELEARGLSDLIKMAVQGYEMEISNCLPEELEPLRNLPDVLDQIALVLAGDEPVTAKERELAQLVQQMSQTINELNRRLKGLHAEKKAGSARRLFADAFYTNAGAGFGKMVSSRLFWSGFIGSGLVLMGVGSEAATDRLAWVCNELILPEGSEVVKMPSTWNEGGAKFVKPTEK